MKIREPNPNDIGVEITDVDAMALTAGDVERLKPLLYRHRVLILRNQQLEAEPYIEFARKFGTIVPYLQSNYHHPKHREIFVSSNVKDDGKKMGVARTGQYWHTDCQFLPKPTAITILHPQILPEGPRDTFFIDVGRVFRDLPSDLQARLASRRCVHDSRWRYKITEDNVGMGLNELLSLLRMACPAIEHPTVIEHPFTKEQLLYVSEGFTAGFADASYEEGKALLCELFSFMAKPEYLCTHSWREGDLLLWDNRSLLHKSGGTTPGQKIMMFRITVDDGLPFYSNGSASIAARHAEASPWFFPV